MHAGFKPAGVGSDSILECKRMFSNESAEQPAADGSRLHMSLPQSFVQVGRTTTKSFSVSTESMVVMVRQ
jgi:hypothetical protein